jgi:translation initiation factor IF-2
MNSGTDTTAGAGGKVRLYEVAKDLGLPNKDLVAKVRALGIEVKNHMSNLDVEDVARVKRALDKERQANLVEERLSSTVIRRRSKDGSALRPAGAPGSAAAAPPVAARVEARPATPTREERPPSDRNAAEAAFARLTAKAQEKATASAPEAEEAPHPADAAHEEAPRVEAPAAHGHAQPQAPAAHAHPETAATPAAPDSRSEKPAAPVSRGEKPAEEKPAAAAAAAELPTGPKKEEPIKYGPTGRVIELPLPRIEIRQADPRDRFQTRDARGQMPGQRRDMPGQRDRFQPGKKKAQAGKKQKQTLITTPAAHKRVIKMEETVQVSELARQMGIKAPDVLKKLWGMGMTGIMLNNSIDQDAATLVANEFGFEIESTAFKEADVFASADDKPEDLLSRAPVVTIMGHVDHGKTSLLDAIRDANVAAGEAGGITQHIGAYKITSADGSDVVFLDTPGHEAFTAMRARGAQATDIVVLVVAADDGVMQTTVEALNHAKQAEVPIIVAVNKIDKANAQPERVRQQLSEHGLIPESWGGETIYVDVSARNKVGIDQLLQMIGLQAEVLELKANPNKPARGTVIEARLDRNRGPMATVLVQEGTLKVGDTVVAGEHIGKVRALLDDKGRSLSEALPSTPVEVLGLSGVPEAGEALNAVGDEKQAKELVEHRRDSRRKKELGGTARVSLENILDKIREGAVKELKVVLKADVQGSAEALKSSLAALSTEQVKVDVISAGVGGITESDVNLAKAGAAIIVGFSVRPAGKAAQLAEQEGVDIKIYDIIYEALDDVKKAMAGLLAPVRREKALGKAEVRQTFTIPKIGTIAGSFVTDGAIKRNAHVRLVRDSVQIYQGKLASLRRFKDDVREVVQGYECGIALENYNDLKLGDVIEAFEIEEIAPTL